MISGYLGSSYLGEGDDISISTPTVQYINLWPIKAVAFAYARRAPGQTLTEILSIKGPN
jgi:hypothetical protein